MALASEEFDGFDVEAAQRFLRSFDKAARNKGENYHRRGAVMEVDCEESGVAYGATVQGSELYRVLLDYEAGWSGDCSCPVGFGCKHIYAAMKQLLAEYSAAKVVNLSGAARQPFQIPRVIVPPVPGPKQATFADLVTRKLARKLEYEELKYLKNINRLYHIATNGGLRYQHELTGLGLTPGHNYWNQLELFPSRPRSEQEFWNYLALYLTEKLQQPIPPFLEPVTDLTEVRQRMRRHQRGRDIAMWQQRLGAYGQLGYGAASVEPSAAAVPVELRLRFTRNEVVFEWRSGDAEWKGIKPRKVREFDSQYASSLSPEAALLWLPYWQRTQTTYSPSLDYTDQWTEQQLSRWLRLPLLRPLLVNEQGEPLVFHDSPVRWNVTQPEDDDGDYTFSLVQANGEPLPDVWLVTNSRPAYYLTSLGVFTGPPPDLLVTSLNNTTLIPAKAFESAGGLRLLERLHVEPPPRLAARLRTVKLHPGVRAEVKVPWAGTDTEYCYVDVYGASDDGEWVEYWMVNDWADKTNAFSRAKDREFLRLDRSALSALIPPLDAAGFKWDYQMQRWQLRLTKKFAETFVTFLKALPPETRIDLKGELASFQNAEVAGKIRLEASETEMDWFDLRVIVDVSDTSLTKEEIKLLLDAKGNWVRLGKKGWRKLEFALSEEEDRELARLGLTPHELTSEPQRLHAFQLADRAARKFLPDETCDRIERRASELQARITPEIPGAIQAEMRAYQRDGFHFLCYLSANRFGGILADDMGLGKTLQTLAWLAWLRGTERGVGAASTPVDSSTGELSWDSAAAEAKRPEGRAPSLVVCPKSVADNWRAEAGKFFPQLKVRVWSASELKSFAGMLASADLHVLNYSQLRLVSEDLIRERFHAVILDEGQYIKNPSSLTAQIARQLRAEHRLILSGTPIENRLMDLWSLMSFAMPGALGTRAEFQRLYDGKNDPFARQRLSARVRPFLIRRTKAQVARDLPDRVEEDLFCELEGEQKTLYRAELKRAQAMLLGVKTAAALNKQRFNFLTSLLRLRQICCHPKLVKPTSRAASAKVEALIETLEPLIEEGQKVLVFSQFVELLDILRREMEPRGWRHWYLAGDTEDRGALVKEFQAAEGAGVFLISLKAGGFGLNLTASSYVVLFDPWWNPAVENQAIDRTHRIGQTNKVIAYRLLIKDSIEEKIRALQKVKKSLAEDVLGEERFSQSLSLDDLRFLLAG
ncbi:MAG TPA: DEAD/DEAH box helicase [Verrucomicrobiae bacterium]|nr:DEAD/DEAH box helicase [Verrucomicrobiae bacterium]